ncbi:MAG: hypothetical protein A2Y40_08675 [Candidatus Margulisbacteria bacterium GWF2_35_9]|nr:MAG: hypothetical protein A2Y40_08675 [Candidatus Margulisbacteria bacterium GWF2_35_9]
MKKFFTRVILFLLPSIFTIVTILTIDPYNYFGNETNIKLLEYKTKISLPIHDQLFKLIEYKNNPHKIIILGDSRANSTSGYVEEFLHEDVTNLCYGGSTLQEIISTFTEIKKIGVMKQVYIGINFNVYNSFYNHNSVPEAVHIKSSLLNYITSKYVIKSTFLILKALIFNEVPKIGQLRITKEEFWRTQLDVTAKGNYTNYLYPKELYNELKKFSIFCMENHIKLVLFIPPTHISLQNRILDFKLEIENIKFKKDMESLGDFYDFDYLNALTSKQSNFSDPFHFIDSISKIVANEIISGKIVYARRINVPN